MGTQRYNLDPSPRSQYRKGEQVSYIEDLPAIKNIHVGSTSGELQFFKNLLGASHNIRAESSEGILIRVY